MSDAPTVLHDAPPSATVAYRTLQEAGELTTTQLCNEAPLAESTARRALRTLREENIVERRRGTSDARKQYHSLTDT